MPANKREELLKTALALFQKQGYHATGIDTILEESGIAKRTLYHHFASKEKLINAVLAHYAQSFQRDFAKSVEAAATTPRARLLAVFDQAEKWFSQRTFYGCMFIKAAGEFPDKRTETRALCREAKVFFAAYLEKLAREARARNPKALAAQLALLYEGAIVTALVSGDAESAQTAKDAAKVLVDEQLRT